MQRVEVCWIDSGTFIDGWKEIEELPTAGRIHSVKTVGTLVHEDEESLFVGLSVDDEERGVYGVQVIARRSIVYVHHLSFMSNETEKYTTRS